jgi:hypothetical protein
MFLFLENLNSSFKLSARANKAKKWQIKIVSKLILRKFFN